MTLFIVSYAVIKFLIGNLTIDKTRSVIQYHIFPLESKNNYVRNTAVMSTAF